MSKSRTQPSVNLKLAIDTWLCLREHKAILYATLAQSVEQGTENPRVAGSIPAGGTIKPLSLDKGFLMRTF
jgi:hypothetical protein